MKNKQKQFYKTWLLLAGLFIVGFFVGQSYGQQRILSAQWQEISSLTPTPQPDKRSTKQIAIDSAFKKTAKITAPTKNEILCLGKTYLITWQFPPEIKGTVQTLHVKCSIFIGQYCLFINAN